MFRFFNVGRKSSTREAMSRRRVRPTLEELEARLVPSGILSQLFNFLGQGTVEHGFNSPVGIVGHGLSGANSSRHQPTKLVSAIHRQAKVTDPAHGLDPTFHPSRFPESGIRFEAAPFQGELASTASLRITVVVQLEVSVPAFTLGFSSPGLGFSAGGPAVSSEFVAAVNLNGVTTGASFGV
jgi:hypothetical protein